MFGERQKITEEMFLSIFWVFYFPPTHLRATLYCLGTGLCKGWYKFSLISSVWPYNKHAHNTEVFATIVWSFCRTMSAYLFHIHAPGMQGEQILRLQDSRNKLSCKRENPTKIFILLISTHIFKNQTSHRGGAEDRNFKHNLPKPKPETLKLKK